jgi:hypothetical protein
MRPVPRPRAPSNGASLPGTTSIRLLTEGLWFESYQDPSKSSTCKTSSSKLHQASPNRLRTFGWLREPLHVTARQSHPLHRRRPTLNHRRCVRSSPPASRSLRRTSASPLSYSTDHAFRIPSRTHRYVFLHVLSAPQCLSSEVEPSSCCFPEVLRTIQFT